MRSATLVLAAVVASGPPVLAPARRIRTLAPSHSSTAPGVARDALRGKIFTASGASAIEANRVQGRGKAPARV